MFLTLVFPSACRVGYKGSHKIKNVVGFDVFFDHQVAGDRYRRNAAWSIARQMRLAPAQQRSASRFQRNLHCDAKVVFVRLPQVVP